MNGVLDVLLNSRSDDFGFFKQVFLFGSSLSDNSPNDIDILLVYGSESLEQVRFEKQKVERAIASKFVGYALDLTTISASELQQTGFLMKVPHKKIKG